MAQPRRSQSLPAVGDREIIPAFDSARCAVPHILVAGVIVGKPKADYFPASGGRPRVEVSIKVDDDDGAAWPYKVVGFDDRMPELEALHEGDAVGIQGVLMLQTAKAGNGRQILSGIFVVAGRS